ncbi:MAG: glycoside hydrolase family 66 protein [Spirochaetia bacterium]
MNITVTPRKAQYRPGENVCFTVAGVPGKYGIRVYHLEKCILDMPMELECSGQCISIGSDFYMECGFSVFLLNCGDDVSVLASTAFDVAESWKTAPRYGFLSGFSPDEKGDLDDTESLARYHLNVIQYYDWMYRHETLLPPAAEYIDPLGRELSLDVIAEKLASCRDRGMACLAYGAVYGASREFAEAYPEWRLYNREGNPSTLGGWLSIMDISPGSEWRRRLIGEFTKSLNVLSFEGIHLDTYGTPKRAYSRKLPDPGGNEDRMNLKLHRLEDEFPGLADDVKVSLSAVRNSPGVIFNCVNNWPIKEMAESSVDALYIEVWPPHTEFEHLYRLIREARLLSEKPVILAAYLSPFPAERASAADADGAAENALALAFAVINTSGAYHLVFGENGGVLRDPYYVNHGFLSAEGYERFRRYADFVVAYRNLLYGPSVSDITLEFSGSDGDDFVFTGPAVSSLPRAGFVWTHIAETAEHVVISLVNLTGQKSSAWNEPREEPEPVHSLTVRALVPEGITSVYADSPDKPGAPRAIDWKVVKSDKGPVAEFTVEDIRVWTLLWIK